MKLIGIKNKSLKNRYIFPLILGIIIFTCGLMSNILEDKPFGLILPGSIIIVISLIGLIDCIKSPNEVIYYDQENKRLLINDKKEIIYLKNINNIRFKQARSRFSNYNFGMIYIEANDQIYKCKHVDNCENICFFLHEEIIKTKNNI